MSLKAGKAAGKMRVVNDAACACVIIMEMFRLPHTVRQWYARRALLLAAAFSAAIAATLVQFTAIRNAAAPIAAGPVALLVTLQIALVLAYLLARHVKLWLRSSSLPGWVRRAERGRMREAPLVAAIGAVAAVVLTVAAPALAPAPVPPSTGDSFVYRFALPDRRAPDLEVATPMEAPLDVAPAPRPEPPAEKPREPAPPAPAPAVRQTVTTTTFLQDDEGESPERSFRRDLRKAARAWLEEGDVQLRELGVLMRQGLPSRFRTDDLPAPHLSTAVMLGRLGGNLDLAGDVDVSAPLSEDLVGEGFTPGAEMTTELALGRRDVVRIDLLGIYAHGRGEAIGALLGSSEEGAFSLWWEHAFIGLSHRLVGYEQESWFDLAVEVGLAFDVLDAEIRTADGASASLDLIVAAPAVGFSLGVWQSGAIGFVIDASQTIPINVGGQAVSVSDLRAIVTCDLSEHISVFGGYRWTHVTFYDHHGSLGGDDRETSADLQLSGPLVGIDIRF